MLMCCALGVQQMQAQTISADSVTNTVTSSADTVPTREKVYKVNPWVELPAGFGGVLLFSTVALPALTRHAALNEQQALALNPADVNWFDRPVIFNDPAGYGKAMSRSDLFLNISVLSPAILGLDKRIRKDWFDLLGMYFMTHTVNQTLYTGLAFAFRRERPYTYNADVPVKSKVGDAKANSFYSGHAAVAAASTFFLAKVYTDYHHITGWRRILLYGAAAVPPSVVGYFRMEGGRHFRTDVMTGIVMGAATGIWCRNYTGSGTNIKASACHLITLHSRVD
ncbi:phosphatase PAP2 family protein [Chitinophaga sedimenti]|uniref:phosphatase PAP2 family protein n=1 Tax=Chitinophaga sedimenti TaxID=2033606 RepID=UPI002004E63C|nr:phosphatase PAP2 family protein [Chitinophaga sedimenti]MCK7554868.1 phosphatase PAP2 family protein [Chitinophaga sedimenti]